MYPNNTVLALCFNVFFIFIWLIRINFYYKKYERRTGHKHIIKKMFKQILNFLENCSQNGLVGNIYKSLGKINY